MGLAASGRVFLHVPRATHPIDSHPPARVRSRIATRGDLDSGDPTKQAAAGCAVIAENGADGVDDLSVVLSDFYNHPHELDQCDAYRPGSSAAACIDLRVD